MSLRGVDPDLFGGECLGLAGDNGAGKSTPSVIMLAAEWMYATWCGRASRRPVYDPDIAEWVRMHATPEFRAQADWLRAGVDALGREGDPATLRRLSDLFGTALRHEAAPA